jgi:hypothetical protein
MKIYYCWIEAGEKMISEIKPENFNELPFHRIEHAETERHAGMAYECDLRIMKWRD